MITLILFSTVLVITLLSWLLLLKDAKQLKIQGPMPLPIIGNAHLAAVKDHKLLPVIEQLISKYGKIFRLYLLSARYVILCDPKYIECILSSSELLTKGSFYDHFKPWLGNGLLTAGGQRWKTHRKLLTPTLHFNILQNFLPVFCKNNKTLKDKLRKLADGKSFDVLPIVSLAALDNVTESIMGVPMNVQTDAGSKYVEAIHSMASIVMIRTRNAFLALDPIFRLSPLKTKQDVALKVLHGQAEKIIETRRKELENTDIISLKNSSDIGIKNKYAFLDLLLLAEIDGQKIRDEHIREEVDTFMLEGHDTVACAVSFVLYCLSKHNEIQEKIFTEQESIFGDDLHRDPTYSELRRMKYLEMVIKECFRIYPPVPVFGRCIKQDTELAGLHIPANTTVIIDVFHMQRSPDIFEDPLRFDPQRFDSSSVHRNPFNWIPFSAGPRNCIGQKFAMMQLKLIVTEIVKNFVLLPSDVEPILTAGLVLRSTTGVHIKLLPRN